MKRFKSTTILSLMVAVMLVFTGCISMVEEITFNKNGSGKYAFTLDLGSMISMLKQMDLGNMLNEGEDGDDNKNEDEGVAEVEREPMVKDSIINFGDMMAERGAEVEKPEFWKKVNMHINVNEPQGIFELKLYFDFKNAKEITYFHENLGSLGGDNAPDMGAGGMGDMGGLFSMLGGEGGIMKGNNKWMFKKRKFTRSTAKADVKKEELSDEEKQQMDMVKMMLSTATWKTIYNFPRKVKSINNDNSTISKNGKTVTTTVNLVDLMDGKDNLDEKIKLKRR